MQVSCLHVSLGTGSRRSLALRTSFEGSGLDPSEASLKASNLKLDALKEEYDYIVIGSGIGGLSSAAMLSYYGYSVLVLESHYLMGGVAHTFEKDGFMFDAGPSLWNGMATRPWNPLREIMELIGEGDTVLYLIETMRPSPDPNLSPNPCPCP